MKLRYVAVAVLAVILAVLMTGLFFVLFAAAEEEQPVEESFLSVLEFGSAGNNGYAVFNYRGHGNITLISHGSLPSRRIFIIDDPQAIEASRFSELVDQLKVLEKYGYSVSVSNATTIGNDVYVVPSGAIPAYILFNLQQNISNGTILYIGEKDLIISNGIKRQAWYAALQPEQRKRLLQYDGTLDEFLEGDNPPLAEDILYDHWDLRSNSSIRVTANGLKTLSTSIGRPSYLRLIYEFEGATGAVDSGVISPPNHSIGLQPNSIFPWQKSELSFSLNKTNGTSFLSVEKDGKEIQHEIKYRVSDEAVLIQRLSYPDPGDYIVTLRDNSGVIASGLLHIKELQITFVERRGVAYVFSVTVDGEPLKNAEAEVYLGNSTIKKQFFISDGSVTIPAKLDTGINIFNFEMYGFTKQVKVENYSESLLDFYIKYGIPGIILIFLVYFGAQLTRKPTYTLRFGDVVTYIREELRLPLREALKTFRMAREDMRIGKSPITPHEFSVSIKRHVTNGADITEGNVEAILKYLVDTGHLENHREFYQLKGEGDIKKNALRRMIKEKLIENGIQFKEIGPKFVTKDYEIGFFGGGFSKKAIIVVDDMSEVRRLMAGLGDTEQAKLRIRQANGLLVFVPIDRLGEAL